MSLKLPKIPSNLDESAKETALRLQKMLAVFNVGGDKHRKELVEWGINRQYFLRSMFYMYLFNKYGNSCIIDENPPCKLLPDICESVGDMVLKVYGFHFMDPTYAERSKWKAYRQYLEHYSKKIRACLKHKDLIVVPVRMHWPGTGSFKNDARGGSHANLLVVRKSSHTIEVVEPHGKTLGTNNPRMHPVSAYAIVVAAINRLLPKNEQKYIMVTSDEVCPYTNGVQALEGYADIFKDTSTEGDGYCSIWSMFTAEMILANPQLTTREIIKTLLDMLYQDRGYYIDNLKPGEGNRAKIDVGNYLLLVARGYATFITRKVEEYFSDIYGVTAMQAIKLGRTASHEEIAEMRRLFGPFLKIQAELSINPKMTLAKLRNAVDRDKITVTDIKSYKTVLDRLIEKDIRYSALKSHDTGLGIELKYKERCPEGKVRNPKTGECVKAKNKTHNNTVKNQRAATVKVKECPPGKELNLKTNRCRKIKAVKTTKIKLSPKPLHITPRQTPQRKIMNKPKTKTPVKKICPNGTRRNPKTKECEPKGKKKILKVVNHFTVKKTPDIVVKKVVNKTRKRCPNGTRRDKKTGECIAK